MKINLFYIGEIRGLGRRVQMKAILLAGGKGERAKPFTEFSPKVMIPIMGKPVIHYNTSHLASNNLIDEIVIVCSKESNQRLQISSYFEGKEDLFKHKVQFVEETYEGTAGAILSAAPKLENEKEFLVWFGDNLVPIDIKALYQFHKEKNGIITLAVSSQKRTETGFVELSPDKEILKFKEKPIINLEEPESLGIYIFKSKILDFIKESSKEKRNINLSFDILEKLPKQEKLYAYDIKNTGWMDVESPTKVTRNTKIVENILKKMNLNSSSEEHPSIK